jgi:uncharacterized phage-associated protein
VAEARSYGVRAIANWILDFADEQGVVLTNMSLNKLTYFAYEHALVNFDRKLTSAKIEAWEHGPVFREIYRSFKIFGDKPIKSRAELYNPELDKLAVVEPEIEQGDQEIICEAISPLINLPALILREISHDVRGPWSAVWNHEDPTNPGMHISDDIIRHNQAPKGCTQ